mmetsp:Transcript_11594/g.28566  ORF Transcript_11594/g.28566 Transcript_11594/m.28566 type:complete len:171 (+) Transcript_11594:177-689(+)
MGGNVSKKTETGTVMAYTLHGFGCIGCKRCCNKAEFMPGAPTEGCCGTSSYIQFDPPMGLSSLLAEFEESLPDAEEIAREHISYCSHIICSQFDSTAGKAAMAIDTSWCTRWNERMRQEGLRCQARSEVFGFGRTRTTFLVIRIIRADRLGDDHASLGGGRQEGKIDQKL